MPSNNQNPTPSSGSTRAAGVIAAGLLGVLLVTATRAVLVKSGKSSEPQIAVSVAAPASVQPEAPTAAPAVTTTASEAGTVAPDPAPISAAPVRARRVTSPKAVAASIVPAVEAPAPAIAPEPKPAEPTVEAAAVETPAAVAPVAQPPVGFGAGRPASSVTDWRTLIAQPGVKFNMTDITDASSGTGGMAGAHSLRTYSNLELRLDFDSLVGWHGFSAYVQHKTKTGRNGSGEASFLQNFSNIDAPDFRAFGEVWVQQTAFNDRLRVRAGRLDFNTEFAGTPNGAVFMNASMGFTPAITAAPTFPLPVGALNVIVSPVENWSLSAGVFDGLGGAPASFGHTSRFQIAQSAHEWAGGSASLNGRISAGAWRHTGMFSAVADEPDTDPSHSGTHGWYATLDQTLWRGPSRSAEDADNRATLAGFAQVGHADRSVAAINDHRGGGLTLSGVWAKRSADVVGLGYTDAHWAGGRESISELFYQMPVVSHLSLVADWQHVGRRSDGSLLSKGNVFTMRTILSF